MWDGNEAELFQNIHMPHHDFVEFDNGEMVETFEKVPVEQVLISGSSGDDIGDLVLKDREMLGNSGIVIISCTLDKDTKEISRKVKISFTLFNILSPYIK